MMWVWQSGRVSSWLAGCLMWCCCLVVETEADVVLLPGGGNWKLMLIFMQCQNVYSVNIQCQKCPKCNETVHVQSVRSPLYFDDFDD